MDFSPFPFSITPRPIQLTSIHLTEYVLFFFASRHVASF